MTGDPTALLTDLVQRPSHDTPDRVREFLVERVERAEIHDESGCVVAEKGPEDGEPHVLLNSHMDVVPPHIEYSRADGVVYGRGACDAKGCLATMICAFERVEPTDGTVTLVVSPDEETYSEGLYDYLALEGERADFAVNGEPTGLNVCNAARGSFKYVIEITGDTAHAGTADSGRSAVSAAAEAVTRLEGMAQLEHDELGATDQTVSWIEGGPVGELTSQVPGTVRLFLNRWSVPPERPADFKEKIEAELSDLDCAVDVRYPYRPNRFLEAYRLDEDEPVVRAVADSVEAVTGRAPEIRPFSVAAESSFLQRYMPVAVFGPGLIADEDGPIAHSDREYLDTEELAVAVDVMERFLEDAV
jgi:acetylornithine deacetylase